MYKLHFFPGACSLATQVILRELEQPFVLLDKNTNADFTALNPVGAVPVLEDGGQVLREGAAIIFYLLEQHDNNLMAKSGPARQQAREDIMFANATMHPAYSRLFFIGQNLAGKLDDVAQKAAFDSATQAINHLWNVVEQRLQHAPYLGGEHVSPADILLAVYSRWGQFFPVNIRIGEKTQAMLDRVMTMENFRLSVAEEEKATKEQAVA